MIKKAIKYVLNYVLGLFGYHISKNPKRHKNTESETDYR